MIEPNIPNRDDLLTEINRFNEARTIPADFKPLALDGQARRDALTLHDLPSEPDAADDDVHQFWTELFSEPLEFDDGDLSYSTPPASNYQTIGSALGATRQQSSLNWSGASITPRNGLMFTDVMAKWAVPVVTVPVGGASDIEYKSSCWVGLDGQRSYADSTLPQLGSEQGINKNGMITPPAASVWFQWWPMDETTITTMPVAFEDTVFAWVTAVSPTMVRCIIKVRHTPPPPGVATGKTRRFFAFAPPISYTIPPKVAHSPRISGATAQWITEAPTNKSTNQIFPLPRYGTVTFQHCYAFAAEGPLLPPFRVQRLIGPTRTRMYKVDSSPVQRVTISTAARDGLVPGLNEVTTTFTG